MQLVGSPSVHYYTWDGILPASDNRLLVEQKTSFGISPIRRHSIRVTDI